MKFEPITAAASEAGLSPSDGVHAVVGDTPTEAAGSDVLLSLLKIASIAQGSGIDSNLDAVGFAAIATA